MRHPAMFRRGKVIEEGDKIEPAKEVFEDEPVLQRDSAKSAPASRSLTYAVNLMRSKRNGFSGQGAATRRRCEFCTIR